MVFSWDGKLVASGSEDGTIAVWDVASGAQGKMLRGILYVYAKLRGSLSDDRAARSLVDAQIDRFEMELLTAEEAAVLIPNGAMVAVSGFTPAGAPKSVPRALAQRGV